MPHTRSIPSTIFDHVVWSLQAADGTLHRAEISLGQCLLLFTSLDGAQEYINACEEESDGWVKAVVFSRSRKEFGRRAREAARDGIVGALFDAAPFHGEAPFLQFAKTSR